MAIEIERKYLVEQTLLPELTGGSKIIQGYIPALNKASVRVRIVNNEGYLTLKGATRQLLRSEFEYQIPLEDARIILDELCDELVIEKTRYCIPHQQHVWEVDIFEKENLGLIVAEVELSSVNEIVVLPNWVKLEVTGNPKYYNQYLMHHPFSGW